MGIESDQVVYEYLSRVGDLAQQRQLPSSARMRLVSELRNEIDRRRAKAPVDSPAAVRRIIARLGTPDDVVAAAGAPGGVGEGAQAPVAPEPRAAVPVQRATEGEEDGAVEGWTGGLSKSLRRVVPRPRPSERPAGPTPPPAADGASPPHLAPLDQLGDGAQTDWWRVGDGPGRGPGDDFGFGAGVGIGDAVPGFVGGVEIPELLKPPPAKEDGAAGAGAGQPGEAPAREGAEGAGEGGGGGAAQGAAGDAVEGASRRPRLLRLRPAGGGWSNPLLLLAAALLVAGAVIGSLVPLGLGWLIAYLSRRLTPDESKWAVLGVPGVVAGGWIVWLWGRSDGRWGDPIAKGQMNAALTESWPWTLRIAALSSAAYLLWRSQRPR
ncbi:hypothetical protein ACWD4G_36260 [Streptomyces sp. NPDC002643]